LRVLIRPVIKVLENKYLCWVGKNSYGIYLWHLPLIYFYSMLRNYVNLSNVINITICLVLSITIGATSEKLLGRKSIERLINLVKNKKFAPS